MAKTEYTRTYSDIRGIKLGSYNEPSRLAYSENMYRDYRCSDGAIESIPGFRRLLSLGEPIHGIFRQRCHTFEDHILVHAGTSLYRFPLSEKDTIPTAVSIGTLSSSRSRGFSCANRFYILDGDGILAVEEDGSTARVGSAALEGYIPTTYLDGVKHEQRNLICDKFIEEFNITDPTLYSFSTEGLHFIVTDQEKRTCTVSGIEDGIGGAIYIPARVDIGGVSYRVTSIGASAFAYNEAITSVKVDEGVERVEKFAFRYARGITRIILPDSLTEIGNGAFADCVKMTEIYFGLGLTKIGGAAFSTCTSMENVYYSGTAEDFAKIENVSVTVNYTISYGVSERSLTIRLPISSDALAVSAVTVDGVSTSFEPEYQGGRVRAVRVAFSAPWEITGKRVLIHGEMNELVSNFDRNESTEKLNSRDAIGSCTLFEFFDGRIFLSGNPRLPNTVFYSSTGASGMDLPLYFGEYDYLCDGQGASKVKAMLSVRDRLAVFKEKDDGSGSIFYHVGKDTDEDVVPRIYPVASIHSGICAVGDAISFFDDPLFVAPTGIAALEMEQINYERSIGIRSSNVNNDLLAEELSSIRLGIWEGYLVVCVGGRVYLADSRQRFRGIGGNYEYEWFKLADIGTYENSARVFRYSSFCNDYRKVHKNVDQICTGNVLTLSLPAGKLYSTIENNIKYALYLTEELQGGDFSPATEILADGEMFIFGTASGSVCIFNNDKRGVPPERISSSADFNPEEYAEKMSGKIHPDFYDFDYHAPRYALKFTLDSCGIPHLTKSTVKNSAVIKCKTFSASRITLEVGTDRAGYSEITACTGGELDFYDIDFSSLDVFTSPHQTLPFGEKEKRWVEKQIALYSADFRRPIGIYSASFRFVTAGRIKKN